MKISFALEINSTPEVVFGWLEDPEKAKQWMTSVGETEILHETADRVGTKFREVVEDENGSIEMHGYITGFEENKSISFHLESRVNIVAVEYTLEEICGVVQLKYLADIQWKFPLNIISLIIGQKIRQNILDQLTGELNKLKELCE